MKKLSVIIASLVLFAGASFAQQTGSPAGAKSNGGAATPSKGGSTGGTTKNANPPVKKVPATKTKTATATPKATK